MLVSDVKSRDIKIDAYTLSFHGRLLIEGAELALNYGNRYGLLGENGSGKVSIAPGGQTWFLISFSPLSFNRLPSAISRFHRTLISIWLAERLSLPMSTPLISLSHRRRQRSLDSKSTSKNSQWPMMSTKQRWISRTRSWRNSIPTHLRPRPAVSSTVWVSLSK